MNTLIIGIIYVLGPVLLLYGCKRSAWLNQFGTVGLAYVFGIVLGNIGIIKPEIKPLQDNLTSVTIALALPGCLYCTGDIGSLFFQVLFSRLFKIDTDTTIIASAAFIFSAPFVLTVANALWNKEIILSGITIGIIGYATGNFLGITLAYLLK